MTQLDSGLSPEGAHPSGGTDPSQGRRQQVSRSVSEQTACARHQHQGLCWAKAVSSPTVRAPEAGSAAFTMLTLSARFTVYTVLSFSVSSP